VKGRVHVQIEYCVSCKRCVLACAVEHSQSKELVAAMTEVPAPKARVNFVHLENDLTVPTECRHCDAAACVAACPTGALFKGGPDGPVVLAPSRCVGCYSCVVACPYGVVRPQDGGGVYKCDMCVERLARDEVPACVEACPTGCLTFKSQDDARSWLGSVEQLGKGSVSVDTQEG